MVGINDDVTHHSLDVDPAFTTEDPSTVRAVFYGLGADGTVGANKNSIKIIGEDTENYAQGYFVYDSKKSGAMTISHLRFGRKPIRASYLIQQASFVACHQFSFLERVDVLHVAEPGAVFLLNSPYGPAEVWEHLPRTVQQQIISKKLRFYVIDAYRVAKETGMGGRINTVMQTCFFALSGALPREEAIAAIKRAIAKTYGKRGEAMVQKNYAAVDQALAHLDQVAVPAIGDQRNRTASVCAARGARFCAGRARAHAGGRGRQPARERTAHRWHLSHRHVEVGKAKPGPGHSCLGRRALHPMRQVRHGLPARGDPRENLCTRAAGGCAPGVEVGGSALERPRDTCDICCK